MQQTDVFEKLNKSETGLKLSLSYLMDNEAYVVVKSKGIIDTYNSMEFTSCITYFCSQGNRKILVFDITDVSYMSSTGIGSFIEVGKFCLKQGIVLYILGMQANISEVFTLLGLKSYFNQIDELTDIKEEKIKRAKFPASIKCPSCNVSIKAKKTGLFKCPKCINVFRVREVGGEVTVEKRS